MTRSKKIFAAFSLVFFLAMAYTVYDISSRTTFPGSRPAKKEIQDRPATADSIKRDSTRPR